MIGISFEMFFVVFYVFCATFGKVSGEWETIREYEKHHPHRHVYDPRHHHHHRHDHHEHHEHIIQRGKHHVHTHWTYDDQENWCYINFGSHCCARHQSPVRLYNNIEPTPMKPFEFINYGMLKSSAAIANNGHTVAVFFKDDVDAEVRGGGLKNTYRLFHLHFHWGSEHVVNDIRAPLEIHFVHYNTKFKDVFSAIESREPDALAVFGVFYWVGKHSNRALHAITSTLTDVQYKKKTSKIPPFNLRKLLPQDTTHFYRYDGSLTTPNCSEVVIWTVFMEPNIITAKELQDFQAIKASEIDEEVEPLSYNYRKTQELFERIVIIGEETI